MAATATAQDVVNGLMNNQDVNAGNNVLNGDYWVGSDGNVYGKFAGVTGSGGSSVVNLGANNSALTSSLNSYGANQISNPGNGSSDTTDTTSSSTIDPSVAALLGSEITNTNNQIADLPQSLQQDLQNITNESNQATNEEDQAWQNAQDQSNTQQQRTVGDLLTAKGQIASNVRQTSQALQTLLGLAGSGDSSASEIAAPAAASQAGTQEQQGVQTQYGEDLQDIDTALNQAEQQHQNNINSINTQQFQADQGAQQSNLTNKINLLTTLAQLTSQQYDANGQPISAATAATNPIMAEVNAAQSQLGQYGSNYPTAVALQTPTSYTAPSISSFNYGSIGAPTSSQSTASTAPNSPSLVVTAAQKQAPTGSALTSS